MNEGNQPPTILGAGFNEGYQAPTRDYARQAKAAAPVLSKNKARIVDQSAIKD